VNRAPDPPAELVEVGVALEPVGPVDDDRVRAFGISSPLSMIVVETRERPPSRATNVRMTLSSSFSSTLAVADEGCGSPRRAPGSATPCARGSRTRSCEKYTCPPRAGSRVIASRMIRSSYPQTIVSTGWRFGGGVSMTDMSARAHEREVEGARDRGGRRAQHIDQPELLLERVLVTVHPEPLALRSTTTRPRSPTETSSEMTRCAPDDDIHASLSRGP